MSTTDILADVHAALCTVTRLAVMASESASTNRTRVPALMYAINAVACEVLDRVEEIQADARKATKSKRRVA